MKFNTATRICKLCFNEIHEENFLTVFGKEQVVCPKCYREMNPRIESFKLDKWEATSCYDYNEKIKTILFNFKACFDYELKDVFLYNFCSYFSLKFRRYVLVPAPSYESKDKERGFNHVVEMFSCLNLPVVRAIRKTGDMKQAKKNKAGREEISQYLEWVSGNDVSGKYVLFVDDLLTTGSTAKACCSLIESHGAKKVSILVMGHTHMGQDFDHLSPFKRLFVAYH